MADSTINSQTLGMGQIRDEGYDHEALDLGERGSSLDNEQPPENTPETDTDQPRNNIEIKHLEKREALVDTNEFLLATSKVYENAREIHTKYQNNHETQNFTFNNRSDQDRAQALEFLQTTIGQLGNQQETESLKAIEDKLRSAFGITVDLLSQNPVYQELQQLEQTNEDGENNNEIALTLLLTAKCQALYTALVLEQTFARVAYERNEFYQRGAEVTKLAASDNPEEIITETDKQLGNLQQFADQINASTTLATDFYQSNNNDETIRVYYFKLLEKYIDLSGTKLAHRSDKLEGDPIELICTEAKFIDESVTSWEEVKKLAEEKIANATESEGDGKTQEVNLDNQDVVLDSNEPTTEKGIENANFANQISAALDEGRVENKVAGGIKKQKQTDLKEKTRQQNVLDLYGANETEETPDSSTPPLSSDTAAYLEKRAS